MSKKISITLLFGGRSAEHEISLISAAAVHKNLKDKFEVRSLYITRDGRWKPVWTTEPYGISVAGSGVWDTTTPPFSWPWPTLPHPSPMTARMK